MTTYRRKGREKEYKREWDQKNPGKTAEYNRRARGFEFSQADVELLLVKQDGRCAACRTSEPGGQNWHVDHDHDTGKVRGILCKRCNTGLGMLGDSAYLLTALLNYLDQASGDVPRHQPGLFEVN